MMNPRSISIAGAIAIVMLLALQGRAFASAVPGGFERAGVASIRTGIAPSDNRDGCCWMSKQAAFDAEQPADTDRLRISTFMPEYAAPPQLPEHVLISINGRAQSVCCVALGPSELVVPLERAPVRRRLFVKLVFPYAFSPKERAINDDPRHLSVLLRGVLFEDARSGEVRGGDSIPASSAVLWRTADAIVLVAGGVCVLLLARRRPLWGVLALLVTVPFDFSIAVSGTTINLAKVAFLMCAFAIAPRIFRERPAMRGAFVPIASTLVLLIVTMILSSIGTGAPHAALRELLKAVEYLAVFVLVYLTFLIDRDDALVVNVLASLVLSVVMLSLIQVLLGSTEDFTWAHHAVPRLAGPLEGPNQLSGYLVIAVVVLLAYLRGAHATPLLWGACVAGAAAALFTFSRGGAFALIVAAALVMTCSRHPHRIRVWMIGIASALSVLVVVSFAVATGHMPFADLIFGRINDLRGGLGTRTLLWNAAFTTWLTHPWRGVGPGNFELVLNVTRGIRTHANNAYLNQLAEGGVCGFAAFLAFTVASIWPFARSVRLWAALGALAASVSLALHQSVDTLWIYPKVGLTWMIVLAFGAAYADRELRKHEQVVDLPAGVSETDRLDPAVGSS